MKLHPLHRRSVISLKVLITIISSDKQKGQDVMPIEACRLRFFLLGFVEEESLDDDTFWGLVISSFLFEKTWKCRSSLVVGRLEKNSLIRSLSVLSPSGSFLPSRSLDLKGENLAPAPGKNLYFFTLFSVFIFVSVPLVLLA